MSPCGIGLTSVAWIDKTTVVVGGVGGQLTVIDIRNSSDIKSKLQLDSRPIHSMKLVPNK